ncbi:MAG: hypothetical protein EZS28_044835, partial [Streblomastix strix]
NDHIGGAGDALSELTDHQEKARAVMTILSMLTKAFYYALFEEEDCMVKYGVPQNHLKSHGTTHAVIIRKYQEICVPIASHAHHALHKMKDQEDTKGDHHTKGQQKGFVGYEIQPQHADNLMQLFSAWLGDHCTKVDRELNAILAGRAAQSALERDMWMGDMGRGYSLQDEEKIITITGGKKVS